MKAHLINVIGPHYNDHSLDRKTLVRYSGGLLKVQKGFKKKEVNFDSFTCIFPPNYLTSMQWLRLTNGFDLLRRNHDKVMTSIHYIETMPFVMTSIHYIKTMPKL